MKNTIIMGQYKAQNISIAAENTSKGDDASTSSAANKNIGICEIAITTVPEAINSLSDTNYDDIGLCTFDTIFCPFTTASGHDNLPYWELPTGAADGDITSYHLNPFNPNNIYTTGDTAGPFTPQTFYDSGHNLLLYNGLTTIDSNSSEDLSTHKMLAESRNGIVQNIRSVGLRSPLILTGPGYDTNNNPVPTGAGGGFHPDAFNNPNLWKSGPVDLRWNNTKKLWQAGGSSSQNVVRFQITDTNSEIGKGAIGCDNVTAMVLEKGCGMTALATGDSITVYDPDFAYFNIPIDLLVGMYGYASEMQNPLFGSSGVADCEAEQAAQGSCYWCVTSLSCAEEEIVI